MTEKKGLAAALELFSPQTARLIGDAAASAKAQVYEIRLYAGKAAVLQTAAGARFCLKSGGAASYAAPDRLIPTAEDLMAVVNAAADGALFLREEALRQGFLTKNGCRVGVCGFSPQGRLERDGIRSVNVRVPFSGCVGVPEPRCAEVLRQTEGLLIAGPPGCGKTTLLKKCAAFLCGEACGWRRAAVIDEREELGGALQADPDVFTADVLRGMEKGHGIQTALRLFSPEYILCDEIGGEAETQGMLEGLNTGVRFIATMHAGSLWELQRRAQFRRLWEAGVFEHVLLMSAAVRGQTECIVRRGEAGL